MNKILISLFCLLIACPLSVGAFTRISTTGVELLRGSKLIIQSSEEGGDLPIEEALVGSYYNGYLRAFNDLNHVLATSKESYCLPDAISSEQIAYIAKRFLERNPDKLHLPDGVLLFKALVEAYSCKQ